MPTPMHVFREIAARHGVDPKDEGAVTAWYEHNLPALPQHERQAIFQEILSRDGEAPLAEDLMPKVTASNAREAVEVPDFDESLRVKVPDTALPRRKS